MIIESPQYHLIKTIRYALLVMLFCYLPQISTTPVWLIAIILAAIVYRLFADYWGYPLLNKYLRVAVVLWGLLFLKLQFGTIFSVGFFIGFLLLFVGLKSIETHTYRDLKVMVLCNFYLILAALIVIQELWIIGYMLIAVLLNFSLMLKLSAPLAPLSQIGLKSGKQLLIAIPISILLFYLFPRIADPLWQVPSLAQNRIGFSERMNLNSINELFSDDGIALRVTFKNKPELNAYWRGLVLSFYDSKTWSAAWNDPSSFPLLSEFNDTNAADYQVILEPNQTKWLFYLATPSAGQPQLAFSSNHGLVSPDNDIISQRFAYGLQTSVIKANTALSKKERLTNLQLPRYSNPRLKSWAIEQYTLQQKNSQRFIRFLQNYIHAKNYWYTLTPPPLSTTNAMDSFWFTTQKGFCEHYASAVTLILRAAGIPARVVVGYQGGEWNPIAQYLTVYNNDAHAWLEYWQEGVGWQHFDPTSFIAPEHVDKTIRDLKESRLQASQYDSIYGLSYWQHTLLLLDSARFFAERWLLFYNQDAQNTLLEEIGLSGWSMAELLQASVASLIVFIILVGLGYQWWHRRSRDPLQVEYHLLQKEFRRFEVPTPPAITLKQQCRALIKEAPHLAPTLSKFLYEYERLRLKQNTPTSKSQKKETIALFKALRQKLSRKVVHKYR